MKKQSSLKSLIPILGLSLIALSKSAVIAADVVKANNADNLNLSTSWVGGVVPGSSDVAVWDSAVSDPNNTTNILGANTNWAGLKVLNPAAGITVITNAGGNALTLGASGIDMSSASQDLTLSNSVTLLPSASQTWKLTAGRTLTVAGALIRPATGSGATLNVDTTAGGNVVIASGTPSALLLSGNQPYATLNLADYAALDSAGNVVAGTSFYGDYSAGGNLSGTYANVVLNVTGTTAGATQAWRNSNALTVPNGVRFNVANSQNTKWTVDTSSSGRLLTTGAILIGPGVGAQNVEFNGTGGLRPNGSSSDLVLHQNNTAGDLIFNTTINNAAGSTPGAVAKAGPGRVIYNSTGNYTGPTRIEAGTFVVNGTLNASSAVTVNNGATVGGSGVILGATTIQSGGSIAAGNENGAGALTVGGALTLNAGATSLKFYGPNVPTTNTAARLVLTNNLTINGAVNVSVVSGGAAVGQYPLIKWTNAVSGAVFANFILATLPPHVTGFLSNNAAASTIDLVITAVNQPLVWHAGNATWDINSSANWTNAAGTTTYQQLGTLGDPVVFDDTATGSSPITVTLNTAVTPVSVLVNNSAIAYSISGSGAIGGASSLTKQGSGTVVINTANTFTGGINLNGGVVSFSTLANLGAGAINFNGGTLQFASGNAEDISARTVTFNSGGATINVGANSVYLNNAIGNSGTGGLFKTGSGTLTLNGTNRYSGNTVISQGTLALGSSTAYISNSAAIILNSGATLDVSAAPVLVLNKQILAGSGTINGGVTVPSGSTLTPGTNGTIATLAIGGTSGGDLTVNGGTLAMDVTTGGRDLITVNGNLSISAGSLLVLTNSTPLNSGVYRLISYTGALNSGTGSSGNLTIVGFSQPGKSATLTDTLNANEIDLVIADTASDTITWSGTGADWDTIGSQNWLKSGTPWAYTNGDLVTFDEIGIANPTVSLKASVSPLSLVVSNETATYTFTDGTGTGGGKVSGSTGLVKNGPGTLLIETANNNTGGLLINAGSVQVGDGSSIVGDIGTGNVTNNGALIFAPPSGDTRTVAAISGSGTIEKQGAGTTIAAANNSYTGQTTITAGTLQIGNGGATGTLGASSVVDNGSLSFNRTGSLSVPNAISGTGNVAVNGGGTITLAASNNYTGGTLVNSGKLVLGNANAISGIGNLSVQAAGTNDLNGHDLTISRLNSTINAGGRIVNNGGTGTNVLTINYDTGGGASDSSVVIADNDGTGGVIRLVKNGTGNQILRGASTYTGGTIINAGSLQARSQNNAFGNATNIILNGGQLQNFSSTLGYTIETWADSGLETSGNCFFNGPLISTNTITSTIDGGNVTMSWGGANQMAAFSGRMNIQGNATTSFFRWTAAPNGSAAANWDLEGNVAMTVNGTGFTINLGSLEGAATTSLQGNNTTYVIGAKNTNTTFSGSVSGTTAVNLMKVGTGTLTLNGSISAPGSTTVSNGVLAIAEPVSLDTFSSMAVRSSGTLDVTGRADSTLNVGVAAAQTLTGAGTVNGNVNQGSLGLINPGDGIGKLNVTGTLTLAGTNVFELNRTNSAATNDMIAATGAITVSGGTVVVTNLGSDLITGDTFKLFNKAVSGLAISFPVSNALNTVEYVWQDNLATDGTIKLLQGASLVNTTPTNIVATVSGNQITLTWPADHTGWKLQVQTNAIGTGLGTNWVDVPNSKTVNTMSFTLDPANGSVFYRMVYP